MIEKTEYGWTGSVTDLPPEVRGNPELAMAAAMSMTVLDQENAVATPMPTCEVCKKNQAVGVACVPGVPYSAAYCKECLEANAHPYFIMVGNTACIGGLEHAHPEWAEMVRCTLVHIGKTQEEFDKDVAEAIKNEEALSQYSMMDPRDIEALNHAAKHLCLVVHNTHPIECACDTCAAACAVVDIVNPPMADEHRQQFERRIAVQKVAKGQKCDCGHTHE